jgi:hypothetical protein
MPQEAVLPDGTILEFPDQATAEQITQAVNQYAQSSRQPVAAQEPTSETADVARGLARGMGPVAMGAAAGLLTPIPGGAAMGATAVAAGQLIGDPLVLGLNHFMGTNLRTPTELFGELFTQLGLDPTSTEAGRIAESVGSSVASTAAGIGIGQRLMGAASATARKIGAVLAEKPLQQLAAAAAGGATAEGARYLAEEMGAGTGGQILAAAVGGVAGGMTGSKLAGFNRGPLSTPAVAGMTAAETAQAVADAEAAGRLVRTSDVIRPGGPISKRMQDIREAVGGREALVKQAEQNAQLVQATLGNFGASVGGSAINDVAASLRETRALEIKTNKDFVKNILSSLDSTGIPVATPKSIAAIDDAVSKLKGINPVAYEKVISQLEQTKLQIQNKNASQVSGNLRLVGDMLEDPALAAVKTDAAPLTKNVYSAMREDLGDFIEAQGMDRAGWTTANKVLHDAYNELQNSALKAALNKGTVTPELAGNLLLSKRKSEVQLLYRNLNDAGKANARAAILEDIASRSLDDKTKQLSTVQFLANLGRAEKQTGVFFKGPDKDVLDAAVRHLNLTKRAGEFNYDPATGQRNLIPLLLGGAGGALGFIGSVATAIGTYGFGRLYETPSVRKLLLQMSRFSAGSPEEFAISKRITQTMQSTAQEQAISDIERKKMPLAFMDKASNREALGNGYVLSDGVNGMKIVSRDKASHKLFDGSGRLVGVFATEQEAKDKATKEVVSRIKRELKQAK